MTILAVLFASDDTEDAVTVQVIDVTRLFSFNCILHATA